MLWTIFVILLVLWLLGIVSSYTLGGFIHILLVVAIVRARNPVAVRPPTGALTAVAVVCTRQNKHNNPSQQSLRRRK